jgi:hypothetical protein
MASLPQAREAPQSLDDVMLAMDVVDTLRHRERLVESELAGEAREAALVKRLKDIYAAQGIEVPEQILKDGVKALEERRFVYEPPKDGFAVGLAKLYVARRRWGRPVGIAVGVAALAAAVYEYGYERPREARIVAERVELNETIPRELSAARDAALALATEDTARARIEAAYGDGVSAAKARDAERARAALGDLASVSATLAQDLTVRIVSRPGEYSGVFRIPDDAPNARNYYLIVEAVDARGRAQSLDIESEEDRATRRVDQWGVRVSEAVFNRVAEDKADDQIIEDAVVGRKPKGALDPDYSIETAGGAILEW